jgi:UDP:flavonoid glycosyltransferase YjiC (YdhE family)
MRVLLSTIGSRGDVQPLVALASQLKALDHEVRVCVPPDFRQWIERLGIAVTPIGPEVRKFAASSATSTKTQTPLSPEQRQQMADATVATQFETITAAALAGAPQVVIPHHYDQHYWARQVQRLGIGTAQMPGTPTTESLIRALEQTLTPDVAARAEAVATAVRRDGVQVAVQQLEKAAARSAS